MLVNISIYQSIPLYINDLTRQKIWKKLDIPQKLRISLNLKIYFDLNIVKTKNNEFLSKIIFVLKEVRIKLVWIINNIFQQNLIVSIFVNFEW